MLLTPKDMKARNGQNLIAATILKGQGGTLIQNIAPVTDNSPTRKLSKKERRLYAKQRAKRNAMPMFNAALCIPPRGCTMAREAFALAARAANPTAPAPKVSRQILESHEARRATQVNGTAGSEGDDDLTPHLLPTEPAAPLVPDPAKVILAERIEKATARKDADARLAAARRFRSGKAATLEKARAAFDDSLRGARDETSNRLNNGISNSGRIRDEAEKALQIVEVKAVLAARKFLEDYSGKSVDLYSANLHRAALDNFIVAISGVHANPDAPVSFGDAIQDFSACYERAYYGMLVRSKCKQVKVIGGGMDGNTLDIKIAAMLKSYTLLLPTS